ncbi:MAG TPA: EAL domain-containing protein [Pseudomonadales bacterium]|nr:EAL domain-containing protein [Pseudomonadales bacterium]
MQQKNETIRLLILHDVPDEAEQLVNAIRNSGRATRAHRITDEDDLTENLKNQQWDLCICRPETEDLSSLQVLQHIQRLNKDIPVIILLDKLEAELVVEALENGAQAAVPQDDSDWLLLAVSKEIHNLNERRLRRRAEVNLREAEKRCQLLLDNSRDAIAYIIDGMHTYANRSYVELFCYQDPDDVAGMPIMDMVAPVDKAKFKEFLRDYNTDGNKHHDFTFQGITTDGKTFSAQMSLSSATYDGEPCTQIVIRTHAADAELQEKLREITSQDLLTGMLNRSAFLQELDKVVQQANQNRQSAAVLFVSIDQFSKVKSNVGIAGVDLVLADIAGLVRQHTLANDILARFGDDEFSIICHEGDPDKLLKYAEALRAAVENHLANVQGRTIQVTISIGIALINETTPNSQELVDLAHQAADKARASHNGQGNAVQLHKEVIKSHTADTSKSLKQAIEHGLLKVLFQPIISLHGETTEIYEVLLRLIDPDGKEASIADYLGGAEPNLNIKLDRWVIIEATKRLALHRSKGHDTSLVINITAETLGDPNFPTWLSVALNASGLPPSCLTFQISETDATTYLNKAKEFSSAIHEMNCRIAVSRFGCALNPFNTLKHMDIDIIKLDASFIRDIRNEENKTQLKAIVNEAQQMNKLTIAPFVESAVVLSTLWQVGVSYVQGFYLQPPMPDMNYDFTNGG